MKPTGQHLQQASASGTPFATHPIDGKQAPVGMNVDSSGHIEGSLPAYGLVVPPVAVGANKQYFDIFNAHAATSVRIRKLFAVVATDVAVTGTLGVRLDVMRTSAAGTAGTEATRDTAASTSKTLPNFWRFDPASVALPTGITSRANPTGGTDERWLFNNYVFTEETNMSSHISQYYDMMPDLPKDQPVLLPTGYGLKVVQGTVASVGNIGFLVCFSVVS